RDELEDREAASGAEDARELAEGARAVGDVADAVADAGAVEDAVREGERLGARLDRSGAGPRGDAAREHAPRAVAGDDARSGRGAAHGGGEVERPGAEVEDPLAVARGEGADGRLPPGRVQAQRESGVRRVVARRDLIEDPLGR